MGGSLVVQKGLEKVVLSADLTDVWMVALWVSLKVGSMVGS